MTIYTMILEKAVVLTDRVEIEADSLEEAKVQFEENEQEYFDEADFKYPYYDDATLIEPYLYGATWNVDGIGGFKRFAEVAADVFSTETA